MTSRSGHDGEDRFSGGARSDWLLDADGATIVRTGGGDRTGRDKVNVRDGRGDHAVFCSSRRSVVSVDAGDRVRGSCGTVLRRGPTLRLPG
jgi:hypothetical protein